MNYAHQREGIELKIINKPSFGLTSIWYDWKINFVNIAERVIMRIDIYVQ